MFLTHRDDVADHRRWRAARTPSDSRPICISGANEDDGRLTASHGVCWYSLPAQLRSLERLDFDFEWVLPGHGRPFRAPSPAAMRIALRSAISVLKANA